MSKKTSSTISISFNNPLDALFETVAEIKSTTLELFDAFVSNRQDRMKLNNVFSKVNFPKFKINKKTGLQIIAPIVLVLVLAIVFSAVIKRGPNGKVAGIATNLQAVVTQKVDREFTFPLTDEKGKKAGEFTYVIESAELRKQIVVKGQNATAIPGRIFLILNIKIVNNLKQGVTINSRDYVRFQIGANSKELFAADIHNDPVEAQAISTKNTRLGLAINETDKEVRLLVGEIDGAKTTIPLEFK